MTTSHSVSSEHYAVKYFLCDMITPVNVFVHIKDDLSHCGISGCKSTRNLRWWLHFCRFENTKQMCFYVHGELKS